MRMMVVIGLWIIQIASNTAAEAHDLDESNNFDTSQPTASNHEPTNSPDWRNYKPTNSHDRATL